MTDFAMITDRVATGGALEGPRDVSELLDAGLNVVLDAREDYNDGPLFTSRPGIHYLWNPCLDDGLHKPVLYWWRTLTFVLPLLAQPHTKVYCHCLMGVNRGPSNALCVLVAQGLKPDMARQLIIRARPQAKIRYEVDAVLACEELGY
jgi:protein-tyrosine phosphatase